MRFKVLGERLKKKIILILGLVTILLISFLAIELPKYKFGYFAEGPEMTYKHGHAPIKLDNGDVFIPGINNSVTYGKQTYIPAEIYDSRTNTFKILDMPKDMVYTGQCFLLKDNKILLLESYKPESQKNFSEIEPKEQSDLMTQMTIFNLNTMQIEKVIDKKIVKADKYYRNTLHSALLGNGQFLIINSIGKKYIEIFDLDNGTSKLLKDNKTDISLSSKVIAQDKDSALIFNQNGTVEKFNGANEKISKVGKFIPRTNFNIFRIDKENILIIGGKQQKKGETQYILDIEIYNTKTNTTEVIGKIIKDKKKNNSIVSGDVAVGVIGDYIIIAGGNKPYSNDFIYTGLKTAEVVNYKTHKQYRIANLPFAMHSPCAIKLDNGDLFIKNNYQRSVVFKSLIRSL